MSSSYGQDDKEEDCALMIWDVHELAEPTKDERIKKNHYGKLRNCVHPKLIDSTSDDNWVLTIAEYMPSS